MAGRKKQQKEFYTWAQFDEDCKKIAEWARTKKFNSIYGVPRGGLVVAVRLSHLLGDLLIVLNKEDVTGRTLIVDDIADKGSTLNRLKKQLGNKCVTATIYKWKNSKVNPDFFARAKKHKKLWIVFPWETEETSKYNRTAF